MIPTRIALRAFGPALPLLPMPGAGLAWGGPPLAASGS
jgi:hypothetical protein